ncbi:non-hydrolyzing UDP-N-acetylglucosamine 2-epimerase [Bacillus sp. B3-WWTP-C-10-D-3]|uniref:non-hydrolyzing UDP-N-acetylglucosamine 2-epimerase n=1 Tax=Bacillus sp. B3-WWTP-C-10-D-3 TaxID=2653217 RepID=UPI000BEDE672|nr:UDP-N-acetylglucosamine 2-epimerase (non-hydrolyzing) [Bacillus sp. B3-WWTP-C-10-D-3]KAB7639890.1 UDP-N-acetylglucosamine 2-epimerase (non-hydrolyzing) [Bacillus sp. B3-WWTP-C-10-D-3]PDY95848.1 UDP-N-acetylglucosamine 2-epimerase (non-hydrolyzing) [Bacillus anthracis]
MNKLKVMTIVGTRPEIIRLSETIKKMDRYFDHILVHTGQNWDYTLNQVFFDELGIREPDHYLDSVGENLGETMGNIIAKSYDLLIKEKPEALLILGDTNSALSAISAKRLKVPIFHMEAGNRCFDQNLPEEINRKIVDHISDVNLPYTEHARRYLISEGYRKEHIYVTGSPMTEVLKKYENEIKNSNVLDTLELEKGKYILVSAHREENIDNEKNFMSLMSAINEIAEHYQMPVIYSTHPRSKNIIEKRGFVFHPLVRNLKPFGFLDYNKLQLNAYCVLSDSGTVPEEASILGFPAVSIRTSTERPEALDKAGIILGGIKKEDVLQSVELCRDMWESNEIVLPVTDYIDTNVSVKVIKIIQSYTKIVDKVIWGKE